MNVYWYSAILHGDKIANLSFTYAAGSKDYQHVLNSSIKQKARHPAIVYRQHNDE